MAELSNELLDSWVVNLFLMLLGYATVFVPGYLIIRYVKNSNYIEKAGELTLFTYNIYMIYNTRVFNAMYTLYMNTVRGVMLNSP